MTPIEVPAVQHQVEVCRYRVNLERGIEGPGRPGAGAMLYNLRVILLSGDVRRAGAVFLLPSTDSLSTPDLEDSRAYTGSHSRNIWDRGHHARVTSGSSMAQASLQHDKACYASLCMLRFGFVKQAPTFPWPSEVHKQAPDKLLAPRYVVN